VTSFGAGTWNDEGVIVFSNRGRLHRVSAAGGAPVVISDLDESLEETVHNWPHFLPDGRHYLYLAWSNRPEHRAIYVGELDAPGRQRLAASESMAVFSMPGYLLFQRQGALFAQAFDATDLTLQGEPIRVAEDVAFDPGNGQAAFAASRNGVLTHRGGGASGTSVSSCGSIEPESGWARRGALTFTPQSSTCLRMAGRSLPPCPTPRHRAAISGSSTGSAT